MKVTVLLATCVLALGAVSASAATMTYTEGKRATIVGSTKIGDAKGAPSKAFDLGGIYAGESLHLHGRMVGAMDTFAFSTETEIEVSFLFGGFDTAKGRARASGFVSERARSNTSVFRMMGADAPGKILASQTYESGILSEASNGDTALIFRFSAGDYLFQIDGSGQGNGRRAALYDIQFNAAPLAAVPLPASSLLLLAGLGALGGMRRKAKRVS